MTQQIPVSSGTAQKFIPVSRTLAYRKSHRLVGELRFDGRHHTGKPQITLPGVLTALQYKGIETEQCSLAARLQYLLLVQTIAFSLHIPTPQATITAIVTAI